MRLYVVATSQKEANELANEYGHTTMRFAERHLKDLPELLNIGAGQAKEFSIFTVEVNK